MAEEEVSQISLGEFETIPQLLASSESLQLAFIILNYWFSSNWDNLSQIFTLGFYSKI